MKTITCLRDLEQYGIIPLTGEADALSFRILCDLTPTGVRVIREAFGLPVIDPVNDAVVSYRQQFAEPWNNGGASSPHVASIMLANDMWFTLGIIALFHISKAHTVLAVEKHGGTNYARLQLHGFIGEKNKYLPAQYNDETDWSRATEPAKVLMENCFTNGGDDDWVVWSDDLFGTVQRTYSLPSADGQPVQGARAVHTMSKRAL